MRISELSKAWQIIKYYTAHTHSNLTFLFNFFKDNGNKMEFSIINKVAKIFSFNLI